MKIKDKFAASLRRWASKLSPETNPYRPDLGLLLPSSFGERYYKIRRLGMAYDISPKEEAHVLEAEKNGYPDAVKRMRKEYEERIAHGIVARLWEDGVVEYNAERNPETGVLRIVGFLYVGIKDNDTNPLKAQQHEEEISRAFAPLGLRPPPRNARDTSAGLPSG